ncbi:MAG: hypothetical protein QF793_00920 [Candidatus Peribacteraceae bacterium]|nr:hypothetical protein [Candidatus Peribacteraceae bacterium]|tara:strand:+ start:3716 stop:4021 length:306 start_codon:yes stop_codon:yes gene_type:complete
MTTSSSHMPEGQECTRHVFVHSKPLLSQAPQPSSGQSELVVQFNGGSIPKDIEAPPSGSPNSDRRMLPSVFANKNIAPMASVTRTSGAIFPIGSEESILEI